jgi:hypothetical protein
MLHILAITSDWNLLRALWETDPSWQVLRAYDAEEARICVDAARKQGRAYDIIISSIDWNSRQEERKFFRSLHSLRKEAVLIRVLSSEAYGDVAREVVEAAGALGRDAPPVIENCTGWVEKVLFEVKVIDANHNVNRIMRSFAGDPVSEADTVDIGRSVTIDLWRLRHLVATQWSLLDMRNQEVLHNVFPTSADGKPVISYVNGPEAGTRPPIGQLTDTEFATNSAQFRFHYKQPLDWEAGLSPGAASEQLLRLYDDALRLYMLYFGDLNLWRGPPDQIDVYVGRPTALGLGNNGSFADVPPDGGPLLVLPCFDGLIPDHGLVYERAWFEMTLLIQHWIRPDPTDRFSDWLWLRETLAFQMEDLARGYCGKLPKRFPVDLKPFSLHSRSSGLHRLLFAEYVESYGSGMLFRIWMEGEKGEHWFDTTTRLLGGQNSIGRFFAFSSKRFLESFACESTVDSAHLLEKSRYSAQLRDGETFSLGSLSCEFIRIVCSEHVEQAYIEILCDSPCIRPYLADIVARGSVNYQSLMNGKLADHADAFDGWQEHLFQKVKNGWRLHLDLTLGVKILHLRVANLTAQGREEQYRLRITEPPKRI